MEPLSGPLPHGLMGLPTSPIPDTSMVAKSRGDHEDKTAQAPATGWSCSRTDRKPSTLAQRPIELCRKRATDNPTGTTPIATNDPQYWTTPEVVNRPEGFAWMPKQGIEYIIALDGDGEFLTTRVESAHYQEQGPRTSTRSEASLTALQRRHHKSVTPDNENQGPRTSISSEASLTALQRRHNKNVTLDNKNQGQDPRSCTTSTLPTSNATLWRQPLSDSEIGSTPTGNPSPFAQYVGLGLDQDKVSGTRSMTCEHMFNYVIGIQVREDSAISMVLIVDEEVLRNRPRHLESCDVEAVLPKEDFGTEKAGHSLQFANGTSKLRKICRVANDTLRLTSHDARTEQTSHDVRTAQTSHDVRTEQSGQLVVQGEGWTQPVVC